MSIWNQIESEQDMKAFKAFRDVCAEYSNNTLQVMKELRAVRNVFDAVEDSFKQELYLFTLLEFHNSARPQVSEDGSEQ